MFTVTVSSIIYGAWWIEVANVSGNTDSECAWLFLITWWSCHHVTCFSIYPYLVKRISPMHEIRNDSKPSLDENPLLFWEVSAGVSFYIVTELTYTDKQKKKPFLWIGLRSDLFFVVCIIFFFQLQSFHSWSKYWWNPPPSTQSVTDSLSNLKVPTEKTTPSWPRSPWATRHGFFLCVKTGKWFACPNWVQELRG